MRQRTVVAIQRWAAQARWNLGLRWRYEAAPRVAGLAAGARLPWAMWLRLCASDAGSVVAEIGRRSGRPLFFLQIGSNDGVTNDPLHDTVRGCLWSGVVVEPLPHLHAALVANYADVPGVRAVTVAIGPEEGTAVLHGVERRPEDPPWIDQLASLDREVVRGHAELLADLDDRLVTTEVECVRLGTLIVRHGIDRLDLLHVDVEGLDDDVVGQVDFTALWAPTFIIYEQKHLGSQRASALAARLRGGGYRIVDLWPDVLAYRRPPSAAS